MTFNKALPVHSKCGKCGAKGRLWEVNKADHSWHTYCFACRMHRVFTPGKGQRTTTMVPKIAQEREADFKRWLKKG